MSDFTEAVLVPARYQDEALQAMEAEYPYRCEWRRINDRWLAIFPDYPDYDLAPVELWARLASMQFPVMLYQRAEDHGWAYEIFSAAKLVAKVEVSYELTWQMWVDMMEAKYPHLQMPYDEVEKDEVERMYAAIEASEVFKQRAAAQFRLASPEVFALFGFDDAQITHIRSALDVGWYLDPARRLEQVNAFAKAAELSDIVWMRFRYLNNDED